jgi:hypothetical protein
MLQKRRSADDQAAALARTTLVVAGLASLASVLGFKAVFWITGIALLMAAASG